MIAKERLETRWAKEEALRREGKRGKWTQQDSKALLEERKNGTQ